MMPACAGLRRPGSAALDLCYVAAGCTDGFFETGLSPWDIAAGSLLVTEAGGLIGNYTGEADFLHQREVLAGSPRIYAQLVGLLSPFTHMIAATPAPSGNRTIPPAKTMLPAGSTLQTPEAALAAHLGAEDSDPAPSTTPADAPSPPKKPAVRITKADMAVEKHRAEAAQKPAHAPGPRGPRNTDVPF